MNNQKCCSPECSDVQKVKRAKASYEKHKHQHQAKKKEKPKAKKEDLVKANEVARNSGMSYGQYMAEKYRAEQLETIGERKGKKVYLQEGSSSPCRKRTSPKRNLPLSWIYHQLQSTIM